MGARGWTAPTWPKEYGGGGLSREEAKMLEREMARIKARPALLSFGIWMLGPVLLEYGNDEQKREHLPKIVRGEIRWCQGYSEPGAGSDLASLAHALRRQRRSFPHQRPENLDILCRSGRLDFLPRAHRHGEKARRHFVHTVRHEIARRRGAADQADLRQFALLRNILHRCESAEEEYGRQTEWRLGNRQAPSAIRAPEHFGQRLRRRRRRGA